MISLTRPQAPAVLAAQPVAAALAAMRAKVQNGEQLTNKDVPNLWGHAVIKSALHNMHYGKCCYCERRRDKAREPDVEHFRPKLKVSEAQAHRGYWWLAYDWNNLLWACKACNEGFKKNHFPLQDEATRIAVEGGDITNEGVLLVNPAEDHCEDLFVYTGG